MRSSSKQKLLETFKTETKYCKRCKLYHTRNNTVFGEGHFNSRIMFIGEAPGKDEDLEGRPFIGKSGTFLRECMEEIDLKEDIVFITNIVMCRPTVNMEMIKDRPPEDDEVKLCSSYLDEKIRIIKPDIICTLGNPASRRLLGGVQGITKIHGKWYPRKDYQIMPLYHPSYVIRNGGHSGHLKEIFLKDLLKVKKEYEDIYNLSN